MNRDGRFCGIFSSTDIREVLFTVHLEELVVMRDIMVTDIISTTASEDLNTVLLKLTRKNIDALPVVKEDDYGVFLGLLYRRDVIAYYNQHIRKIRNPGT
jgi:CIC family chloride channel protein